MTFLNEIQSRYSSFSVKEKVLADYLLSAPAEASRSTTQMISERTNVSTATITRFCKKVDCENFAELKIKLASVSRLSQEKATDSNLTQQYKEIFNDLQGLNSEQAIDNLLNLIKKSKRIYIYGLGSSGLAAQELNYRLSRMGFTSEALVDSHLMIIRSSLLKPDDLLLVFSRSGQTKEIILSVKQAKKNGAKIGSLTAYDETELTELSDEILNTIHPSRSTFMLTGLDLGTLYLIDLLSLYLLKDPQRLEIYNKTIAAIASEAHLK